MITYARSEQGVLTVTDETDRTERRVCVCLCSCTLLEHGYLEATENDDNTEKQKPDPK